MPRYRGAVPSTAGGQTGMLFGAQGDRVPWIESPLHCIYMKGGSWRCLCPRPWKISQWLCRGVLSNFQIGKPAWRKHTHEELLGSSFFPTSAFLLYCTALDRPKKKNVHERASFFRIVSHLSSCWIEGRISVWIWPPNHKDNSSSISCPESSLEL